MAIELKSGSAAVKRVGVNDVTRERRRVRERVRGRGGGRRGS